MTRECQFDVAAFDSLLNDKTKIVALAQVTNVTGTRQPIEEVIDKSTFSRCDRGCRWCARDCS